MTQAIIIGDTQYEFPDDMDDAAIRKLAAQFAREETLHIAWIEEALLIEPQPVNPLIDFLEPPKAAD